MMEGMKIYRRNFSHRPTITESNAESQELKSDNKNLK
jgi:hypothetical protein